MGVGGLSGQGSGEGTGSVVRAAVSSGWRLEKAERRVAGVEEVEWSGVGGADGLCVDSSVFSSGEMLWWNTTTHHSSLN